MTAMEEERMFHIDPGRPACIWTRGTRPPMSASHLTEIKDIPELDRMTPYQCAKVQPPTENEITVSEKMKSMRKPRPRTDLRVIVMTTTKDDHLGGVAEYNGLLVYHDENTITSLGDWPLLGWTIASTPCTASGGNFMALMFCKKGLTMAIINKAMGEQMLDLCHAAKIANRLADTIVKGFVFGDRVNKLFQQLGSTDIVALRPHHMMGHHSMDVSMAMAGFDEAFCLDKEGQSLTLLPTMMPMQILDTAFKFVEDMSDADTIHGAGWTIPTGPSGFPDTTYHYRSLTRRRRKTQCGAK